MLGLTIVPAGFRFQVANIPAGIYPGLSESLQCNGCEVNFIVNNNSMVSFYVIIPKKDDIKNTKTYIRDYVKART